ncbi:hypothetical protein WJX73_007509 [Symbiochloris irregularis]|uniref:Uncharacterized protein n=1 Tax=Symbiochloris irregularis TaxID=706552 RepID=A0AAW1NYV0_9CHLO
MPSIRQFFVRLWQRYETALHSRPFTTQSLTSGVLWGVGDIISQRVDGDDRLDLPRTAWTAFFGAALIGPAGHAWYQALDRVVGGRFTRGTMTFIVAKVAADELTFGPLHVASFFSFMTLAQGGTLQDVREKLRRDFVSAYVAELAVWPAFQAVNFSKVPVRHQLLMVNLASLADATFLCWVKSQEDWMAQIGLISPKGAADDQQANDTVK